MRLRRKIQMKDVQWSPVADDLGKKKAVKLSPEEVEELKEQTRQSYEARGLDWRGKMIPLRFINSLTGGLELIDLDFRGEV